MSKLTKDQIEEFFHDLDCKYPSDFLTALDIEQILGRKRHSIYNLRLSGNGPPYIKMGNEKSSPIRYLKRGFFEWFRDKFGEKDE